ncbi:recombinase family protein [Paludisphaera sp. Pla2]|uniref:Recombinase family protein n=1 Tax=Paludisphaera mucosa TaxID=3030827 RepID=A0ABT6FID5_9BACT|nr:recombinase family protein [Paludisphaera mucosa]MDG3007353.1 recombinase family protein [Paludisphaera mucosa]
MKIAIYARVSTQRQAEAQTIDEQIGRLREHARGRGWDLQEANVFRDDGYSGAALKRPGLDRLRDAAAMASFDAILLTDPDRLARNFVHQTLLLEELQSKGCRVEFLDRPMSRDPHDQLLLQIRGAVAEYERTLIAERTRRGRQRRYRAGEMLPWTRAPYGYRMAVDRPRDPSGVHLDPCEAAVVAEMFAWYSEGRRTLHGLVDHLRDLGVPSPSGKACWSDASVRGILRNPAYTGRVYAGRHRYREARARRSATHPIGRPHGTAEPTPRDEWIDVGPIPAVVDPGLFERVQAKLAANRSFSSRNNKVGSYLLRCLVSCGHCGLASIARRRPPHYGYYTCTGKSRAARNRNGATCGSRFIPAAVLDDLVWGDLCELLRDPAAAGGAFRRAAAGSWHPQEFQARRERLRQGKASLSGQLDRLTEAYLGGVVPLEEYRRRRGELESRQQTLAEQEARLAGESERLDEVVGMAATLEAFCGRIAAGLETATFDGKRQLVELLVDRVVVTGDEVEIRYVLPTSDKSENIRFCHLRSDYLDDPPLGDLHEPDRSGRPLDDLHGVGAGPVVAREPGGERMVAILRVASHRLPPRASPGRQPRQDVPRVRPSSRSAAASATSSSPLESMMWRLRPRSNLPPSQPRVPPTSVPLTVWLSIQATRGAGWRPDALRTLRRNSSWMRCQVPSSRQRAKWSWTVLRAGRSCGSMSHWQPERLRCRIASTTSRTSTTLGRPSALTGIKGSKTAHRSSLRSEG